MTEPATETIPTPPTETAPQFAAITSQEDFDRRVQDRLKRQRDQFKDYDDLKAKASEYDKLAEASKTAEQKATDRAQAAEQKANAAVLGLAKAQIKAIATGEFIDSEVPFAFLDPAKYVKDNGEVDSDAIETDLKELLKTRPTLSAHGRVDVGLGARSGTATVSPNQQMNDHIRRSAGRQ